MTRAIRCAAVAATVIVAIVLAGCGNLAGPGFAARLPPARVYVGTYTSADSRGIYVVDFDPAAGRFLSEPRLAATADNPSFLALHPNGHVLYAVNELQQFNGTASGAVSAFHVDPARGDLTLLNQESSRGADPCFVVVDPAARHVLVANYTGGTYAVLPIAADGRLTPAVTVRSRRGVNGPVTARQQGSHVHDVVFDPSGQWLVWTDLGTDSVVVDRFDAQSGGFSSAGVATVPGGSGPRHVAWHPSGRVLYVLNELTSTVTTMPFELSTPTLSGGRTVSARTPGATGDNTAAEIAVSNDGRFLYTSNRGDDDVMVFAIDATTMALSPIGSVRTGGKTPRHFAIDPSGRWMIIANQGTNSVIIFRIDAATGMPQRTPERVSIPAPVNIVFAKSQ
jgi:6-phosphogluconolactonase